MEEVELEYVGFWPRVGATIIDWVLILVVTAPILTIYYGKAYWSGESFLVGILDFILSYIFPAVATIMFWVNKQATPGKMAISSKVIDAKTGGVPSLGQYIGRYFGYIVSAIPLGLGVLWVFFDPKKQSWHDKLSGTVVVRPKNRQPKKVVFDGS